MYHPDLGRYKRTLYDPPQIWAVWKVGSGKESWYTERWMFSVNAQQQSSLVITLQKLSKLTYENFYLEC